MSHTRATLATPGVTFVPLPAGSPGSTPAAVELPGPTFADRLLQDLGPKVTDLAEYARNAGPGDGGTTVLLTSCRRGDGCSTLAWALARAGAGSGPVLVVDGDLTHPDLSAPLHAGLMSDWTDVLHGRCAVDQVQCTVPGQGVTFLPLLDRAADAVLGHPALPLWLARLRQEFGLVVLDGGPVDEGGRRWARWLDSALLVCDPAQTPVRGRAEAWDALETTGTHVLGIVETFV
jgi:Mrp family chromosome partitioning ATPase